MRAKDTTPLLLIPLLSRLKTLRLFHVFDYRPNNP
jgi:hypothetical protein